MNEEKVNVSVRFSNKEMLFGTMDSYTFEQFDRYGFSESGGAIKIQEDDGGIVHVNVRYLLYIKKRKSSS